MRVLDITDQLTDGSFNYWVFNPAIAHYRDDLYLCVYRSVKYDLRESTHPWKVWDGGYKQFKKHQSIIDRKYRTGHGSAYEIDTRKDRERVPKLEEFDTTSFALLSHDGKDFRVLHKFRNVFLKEANQDCRISRVEGSDGRFALSYTVFESRSRVKVKTRDVTVGDGGYRLSFSRERDLLANRKPVEKNCVRTGSGDVIYELYPRMLVLDGKDSSDSRSGNASVFEHLFSLYGRNNVLISGGSPPIRYDDRHDLALGHIKVRYENIKHIHPFSAFYDTLRLEDMMLQGTYMYFCFLYLYDRETFDIAKISNPFVPQMDMGHLPYVLSFPMSIFRLQSDAYGISYGEGDCRCKVLVLSVREVGELLVGGFDGGFYFLTNSPTLFHYGYFGNFNTGDDAFVDVFKYLHRRNYPSFAVRYGTKLDSRADLVALGGGDVINPYFVDPIAEQDVHNVVAVGVGLPYPSEKGMLKLFRHAMLRNKKDFTDLRSYYDLSYFPDLAFLLPDVYPDVRIKQEITMPKRVKHVGICLTQTFYHESYPSEYARFVSNITDVTRMLMEDGYHVHLIPFCINRNSDSENDVIMMRRIVESIGKDDGLTLEYDATIGLGDYAKNTYRIMARMDFNVCTRFHSHVFSIVQGTPFVSLSCSRKCSELMKQIDFKRGLYSLETNDMLIPTGFDPNDAYRFIKDSILRADAISKKVLHVRSVFYKEMKHFEKAWCDMVYRYIRGRNEIMQLFPPIHDCHQGPCSPPFLLDHPTRDPKHETTETPMMAYYQPVVPMYMQPATYFQPVIAHPMMPATHAPVPHQKMVRTPYRPIPFHTKPVANPQPVMMQQVTMPTYMQPMIPVMMPSPMCAFSSYYEVAQVEEEYEVTVDEVSS